MRNLTVRRFVPFALLVTACSGATTSDLLSPPDGDAGPATPSDASHTSRDGDTGTQTPADSGPLDAAPSTEAGSAPVVHIHVVAVQTPVGGGTSQETPTDQRVGIMGLTLLKDPADPSPLVVLAPATPIDTPYNAGSDTVIGSVPASALPAGSYTVVRVPVAYVNFTVAGTYHLAGVGYAGDFSDVIALTTGVTLDGATRARGWYSTAFSINGVMKGSAMTGSNADIAQPGSTSGIALDLTGPVAAYVFGVNLTIPPDITSDMDIVFTVNTYEDFHWQDENDTGYQTGVFDVSAGAIEPVTQLGANSFTVALTPASGS